MEQDKAKLDELVARLEQLSVEYEKLYIAFNEKLREIEGLKLKIVGSTEKEKEAVTWKNRHKDLENAHSAQLEHAKQELDNLAQQKLVIRLYIRILDIGIFFRSWNSKIFTLTMKMRRLRFKKK